MAELPLQRIIEAALFAADRPLTVEALQQLFEADELPDRQAVQAVLQQLTADYAERGIELVELAGGFRLQTRSTLSRWVSRLWEERSPRYSRALLETLALIAYRQPITRGEIEEVRGVAVSSPIIKTLQEREWIRIIGYREVPGRPALFATTRQFLDYFNLKSLDQLPPLSELRSLEEVERQLDELVQQGRVSAVDESRDEDE